MKEKQKFAKFVSKSPEHQTERGIQAPIHTRALTRKLTPPPFEPSDPDPQAESKKTAPTLQTDPISDDLPIIKANPGKQPRTVVRPAPATDPTRVSASVLESLLQSDPQWAQPESALDSEPETDEDDASKDTIKPAKRPVLLAAGIVAAVVAIAMVVYLLIDKAPVPVSSEIQMDSTRKERPPGAIQTKAAGVPPIRKPEKNNGPDVSLIQSEEKTEAERPSERTNPTWWCLCNKEMLDGGFQPSTVCRPSSAECQALAKRTSTGSRSIEADSLLKHCTSVRADHPADELGDRSLWRPSAKAGSWWAPGRCLL